MRKNLVKFLPMLKAHEGGYVNHPRDPGGCTNLGITIATYRAHVNKRGTCADLKKMSWNVAADIYAKTYWRQSGSDMLPAGVDVSVFDMGVNAGPSRAVRLLQEVLGVSRDGKVGPATAQAARDFQGDLVAAYAARRLRYYRSLRTWRTFGRGWARRLRETEAFANDLVDGPPAVAPVDSSEADHDDDTVVVQRPGPQHLLTIARSVVSATLSARDPDVHIAQALLAGAGFSAGAVDGVAGPKFTRAVRAYQKAHGLQADGICGKKTWASLEDAETT